jgi:RHS repeat-associated protein
LKEEKPIFNLRVMTCKEFFEKVLQGGCEGGSKSGVVYYPFGLTFNSYQRENSVPNRYLFNQGAGEKKFNTERIFDLGLSVDFSKFRVYDPAMGRWWQVDPLADEADFTSFTPYNYSFNNPIRYNDPLGDCPGGCPEEIRKQIPEKHPANYQPSQATQQKYSEAKEHLTKVFTGSIGLSGKVYGASGKVQAGPVQLKGEANVAKVSGKVTQDGAEIKVSGLNATGSASFASAKASASFTGAEAKATFNSDGVQVKTDALNLSGNATLGENGFEMTANNSAVVGVGASVSVVKAEASVNLGEAVMGLGKLIDAGLSYAADLYRNGVDF